MPTGDDVLGDGSKTSPFATIQRGIDAAVSGEMVIVGPGTYTGLIDFDGKSICVKGEFGPDSTIILSLAPTVGVIRFDSGEDTLAVLEGFRLESLGTGDRTDMIMLVGSSATIRNCFFSNGVFSASIGQFGGFLICEDNIFVGSGVYYSPGVYVETGQGRINRCQFKQLVHYSGGAAVQLSVNSSNYLIENSLFLQNRTTGAYYYSGGAGIFLLATVNCTIRNNTFVGNTDVSADGGAIGISSGCSGISIENNIFVGNNGYAVANNHGSQVSLSCNDAYANLPADYSGSFFPDANSFSLDPQFCDTALSEYHIRTSSPCAPANNSCGVLIGASAVGCANLPPLITSSSSAQAVSGLLFSYVATSTDSDGPSVIYSFVNSPSWLTANSNSVYGIPPLTDVDTSFVVIVSDGFLADSQLVTIEVTESPILSQISVDGTITPEHVFSNNPRFSWTYFDATASYPQIQYEVAVGSDSDWAYSELWNPAPFSGSDTALTYAGAPLVDGQSYWVRARLRNALIWSNWKQQLFRMNTVPTVPSLLSPASGEATNSVQPIFIILNSGDAESDSLCYILQVSSDSSMQGAHQFVKVQDPGWTTSAQIDIALSEDAKYYWRAKASDYYEESGYSNVMSFWVNSTNSAPAQFDLVSPANTFLSPLTTKFPVLQWTPTTDVDPFDQVSYAIHLAIDSNFTFANLVSGINDSQYTPTSALVWGTRYWWKVKALDLNGGETWSTQVFRFRTMALGDADGNGIVTISDVVFLINYIFSGGPTPNPLTSGDADCSGAINISDAVHLIQYIFGGGAPPCEA